MSYTVEKTKITPTQVNKWYAEGLINKNRPLKKSWVGYLSRQMTGGRFQPTNTITIGHLNGTSYLINGQHTLAAIVQSGTTYFLPVAHHRNISEKELAHLYANFDIGNKRSFSDAMGYYGVDKICDLSPTRLNKLAAALGLIAGNFSDATLRKKTNHLEWVRPVQAYAPYFTAMLEKMHRSPLTQSRWQNAAFLSIMLITMAHGPDNALGFWDRMTKNDGLKKGDPAKRLHEFIAYEHKTAGGGTVGGYKNREASKIAAYCWNANYESRKVITLRVSAILRNPIKIAGTPYEHGGEPWTVNHLGELKSWLPLPNK